MNLQVTNEIRELTAAELDAVSGGYNPDDYGVTGFDFFALFLRRPRSDGLRYRCLEQ